MGLSLYLEIGDRRGYTRLVSSLASLVPLRLLSGIPVLWCAAWPLAALAVFVLAYGRGSKVGASARTLFEGEPLLWLMPVLLFICMLGLAGGVLAAFPATLIALVWLVAPGPLHANEALVFHALCLAIAGGVVGGALVVTVVDSVIADSYVSETENGRAWFLVSAGKVLWRLPALLVFGLLWGGTLAIGFLLTTEALGWVRVVFGRFGELALLLAAWAADLGFTLATYFMIVMMIREGLGPLEAYRSAVALARAEFLNTLGRLWEAQSQDAPVGILVFVGFMASFVHAGYAVLDESGAMDQSQRLVAAAVPCVLVPVLIVVAGFCVEQTVELLTAAASYLYVREGIVVNGFSPEDLNQALGLRAASLLELFGRKDAPRPVGADPSRGDLVS